MKIIVCGWIGLMVLFTPVAFAQPTDSIAQKKASLRLKKDSATFARYSYPYYAIINNSSVAVSGCFINYKSTSYFVTSRNNFYTPNKEKRKVTKVMIFVDQSDLKNTSKALAIDMTDADILPVCFDSGCVDIVLLPVKLPKELSVNYVTLDSKETIDQKEMSIVGFIKDSLHFINTKFHSDLPRDEMYFLTEQSGTKDQAGSPVLMYTAGKGKTAGRVTLAGVFSGKEFSQEYFDKGLIARATTITKFLDEFLKIEDDKKKASDKKKKSKPKSKPQPSGKSSKVQ